MINGQAAFVLPRYRNTKFINIRLYCLKRFSNQGINPYPYRYPLSAEFPKNKGVSVALGDHFYPEKNFACGALKTV